MKIKRKLKERGISSPHLYDLVLKNLPSFFQDLNVLDYGAGKGHLLFKISQDHPLNHYYALDQDGPPLNFPDSIYWLKKNLNLLSLKDLSLPLMDLILSTEVIEHLENPWNVARYWFDQLVPGGAVIFTTPNCESFRSLLSLFFRGHFVDFDDSSYPEHRTPLLEKDIERILSEAGFSSFEIDYSNQGAVPHWTSITWQKLSFGFLKDKRFSDHFIVKAFK